MPILFHMTPAHNLNHIQVEGLKAQIGARSLDIDEPSKAVYLFRTLEGAEDGLGGWFGDCFDEDETLCLLAVHLPIEIPRDTHSYEFIFEDDIPAAWITVLARDVDSITDFRTLEDTLSEISQTVASCSISGAPGP